MLIRLRRVATKPQTLIQRACDHCFTTQHDVKGNNAVTFPKCQSPLIGAILLALPIVKGRLKEWVYAGFGITFISAFTAHITVGDPVSNWISPLVTLAILTVSNIYYHRLQDK